MLSLFSRCSHCLGPLSEQEVRDGSWLENETEKGSEQGKEPGEARCKQQVEQEGKGAPPEAGGKHGVDAGSST